MIKIIPTPVKTEYGEGFFTTEKGTEKAGVPEFVLNELDEFFHTSKIGKSLEIISSIQIKLKEKYAYLGNEGYRLTINKSAIIIEALKENGAFYAVQTLKQILFQCGEKIPVMTIEDSPRFSYRGFMLDVGRYFYKVEEVKKFLDLMVLHKLNTFHFHLTEDQGWRIEIKKYPLLTQKGSRRSHTNFGFIPRSGFYTQEQIREIVSYAHSKFIRVIPEFDIPGHTVSAIACYPYLSCFDRKLKVATHWGVKHDILCAGKESTYKFVFDVLDEIAELFPDGEIHLGGDEAYKMRWNICPRCQAEIKKQGLRDSEELQQFFMSKVNAYLREKGIKTIMWNWDDIEPTKWLDPSIAWNLCGISPEKLPVIKSEMASGRDMIITSSFPYYLDLPYGWINLKFAYEFDPVKGFSDEDMKHIRGIEAPLWTEYVPDMRTAYLKTFPRLGAICETAWTQDENRSWENFLGKLDFYNDFLSLYGVKGASLKKAMPSKIRAAASSLWFNRRQLHWQGLHNLIDDAVVKRKAK